MIARRNLRHSALAAFAAAALLGACDSNRASVLEPFGEPVFNFPLATTGAAANLPRGTVAVARPAAGTGSITVTLRGLEPLNGAVYQVWLATDSSKSLVGAVPARGTLRVIKADTAAEGTVRTDTAVTQGTASSSAGGQNVRLVFTIDNTSLGSNPTGQGFNVVFVSIETSETTTPSNVRPLFARFPFTGASANVNLLFGNYDPNPALQYVFVPTGRGIAGIRGNTVFVDDSSKGRPPRGYYYAGFLIQRDTNGVATDTISLGEMTAPFPRLGVSLRDADIQVVDPTVTDRPFSITASSLRYTAPGTERFVRYEELLIVLKNKRATDGVLPPNRVLAGAVPEAVSDPKTDEDDS